MKEAIANLIGLVIGVYIWIYIIRYFLYRNKPKFTCPQCEHIQRKGKAVKNDVVKFLSHGRYTMKGELDHRYNATYDSYTITTYKVECKKCRHKYKYIHDPSKKENS